MAKTKFTNIQIKGISCCVPSKIVENDQFIKYFDEITIKKIEKLIGVKQRRIVDLKTCTSDLCFAAANDLLNKISWDRDSIDALIFVTQTADYRCPATACILQDRLGLSQNCAAFDVNLACSGYVYGLWLANSLINSGLKRVLLLAGDTSTMSFHGRPGEDRSTLMLFGDAGSATAIESLPLSLPLKSYFCMGTDGRGYLNLITPTGGHRNFTTEESFIQRILPDGSKRRDIELHMNGKEIFNFCVTIVPVLMEELLKYSDKKLDNVDYFVFHQANEFIINHIRDFLDLNPKKIPMSIREFGNTSSASIPLSLVNEVRNEIQNQQNNFVMLGFGAGYSWAGAFVENQKLDYAGLIEYDSQL